MKKLYFCLAIYSVVWGQSPHDAIINLGGDCQVAYQMQRNGLRKYALPFDKLITPFGALKKLLEHAFEGFLDADNFEFIISDTEKYILDKKYGTRWIHDFKLEDDFLVDYEPIKETYKRRINRLLQIITESEYPLFIRKIITKNEAIELKNVLEKLRLHKPFLLLVVDGTDEIKDDWQLKDIRNYYLRQPVPYVWKGDAQAWQEIFKMVGLELASAQESTPEI